MRLPTGPRTRRALRVIRDALIIVAISAVLTEAALRAYNAFYPLPIFYSGDYNRFRGKPNAPEYDSTLNSRGFNDVERSLRKPEGTFRIVAPGGSFAFGVVPHAANYLTLLENSLNRGGRRVEVVNMGIPATGIAAHLALLAREGLDFNPDMVLATVFSGDGVFPTRASLSYLATAIRFLFDLNTKVEGHIVHGHQAYDDSGSVFTDKAYLDQKLQATVIFKRANRAAVQKLSNQLVSDILRMKEMCDARNIRLSVVVIPDEAQVDGGLQQEVVMASGSTADAFDFGLPNELLNEALSRHGIDHIDVLDAFVAASPQGRLYRPNDSYWNIRGNALAAQLIAEHLKSALALSGQ